MGREVRYVAADWSHPVGDNGKYEPLYTGEMPRWSVKEANHYQMYETVSAGTPISPVMPSPERLAQWLVANKASAFGRETASFEAWLRVCRGEPAVTCALDHNGRVVSGVEYDYREHCKALARADRASLRERRKARLAFLAAHRQPKDKPDPARSLDHDR